MTFENIEYTEEVNRRANTDDQSLLEILDPGYDGIGPDVDTQSGAEVEDALPELFVRQGDSFGPGEGLGERGNHLRQILADIHVPVEERQAAQSLAGGGKYRMERVDRASQDDPHSTPQVLSARMMKVIARLREKATVEDGAPTREEKALIGRIHDAFRRIGDMLEVNIVDRLLSPGHYYFFDDQRGILRAAESISGHNRHPPVALLGQYYELGGALICRRKGMAATLAHETAHSLELQRVWVRSAPDGTTNFLPRAGLKPLTLRLGKTLVRNSAIREVVVDMLGSYALEIAGLPPEPPGRIRLALLGSSAVVRAAAYHGIPPHEMEGLVVQSSLVGDVTGLDLVTEALGEEAAARFFSLPGQVTASELAAIAEEIGLPEARLAIEGLAAGRPAKPFNWHRPLNAWRPNYS